MYRKERNQNVQITWLYDVLKIEQCYQGKEREGSKILKVVTEVMTLLKC